MKTIRKIMVSVITALMLLSVFSTNTFAEDTTKWQVDKSKKATALDKNNQTTVTLSLPSAETNPKVEIVFVMDHSGYADIEDIDTATISLLDTLKAIDNLDIRIGVVKFDGWGIDAIKSVTSGAQSGMVKLDTSGYDTILNAIKEDKSTGIGGSNTEQPIRMANHMLADGDSEAEKFLVVLSDFHTYVYEGSVTINGVTYDNIPVGSTKTYTPYLSNLEDYTTHTEYNSWASLKALYDANGKALDGSDWLSDSMFFRYGAKSGSIELPYSQQAWVTYDYSGAYDTTPTNKWITLDYQTFVDTRTAIKNASTENHVTGNQRSMLLTYDAMKASIDAGYNVITYRNHVDPTIDWMKILKNMPIDMLKALADLGAKTYAQDDSISIKTAFDYLKGEVLYLVGSGTLTDVIAPHFDTVIPASGVPYTVTLHGEELTAQSTGTNEWSYGVMDTTTGKYPYVITYAPGADEKFVVQINVPVERSKQLKISYKLQLLTDGLASGKYPTNTSATLEYKDSNGENPGTELFEIPTVVYKGPNVPNTGDENNIYMYGSVMLLALGGAIFLTYNNRKKKYN